MRSHTAILLLLSFYFSITDADVKVSTYNTLSLLEHGLHDGDVIKISASLQIGECNKENFERHVVKHSKHSQMIGEGFLKVEFLGKKDEDKEMRSNFAIFVPETAANLAGGQNLEHIIEQCKPFELVITIRDKRIQAAIVNTLVASTVLDDTHISRLADIRQMEVTGQVDIHSVSFVPGKASGEPGISMKIPHIGDAVAETHALLDGDKALQGARIAMSGVKRNMRVKFTVHKPTTNSIELSFMLIFKHGIRIEVNYVKRTNTFSLTKVVGRDRTKLKDDNDMPGFVEDRFELIMFITELTVLSVQLKASNEAVTKYSEIFSLSLRTSEKHDYDEIVGIGSMAEFKGQTEAKSRSSLIKVDICKTKLC